MLRMLAYEYAYLSPIGWPCIYSGYFTSWMVIRILSHRMGYFLDIGFDRGYRKCSLFGIIFFPYWGIRLDLMMSCNIVIYLTFLIGKI